MGTETVSRESENPPHCPVWGVSLWPTKDADEIYQSTFSFGILDRDRGDDMAYRGAPRGVSVWFSEIRLHGRRGLWGQQRELLPDLLPE